MTTRIAIALAAAVALTGCAEDALFDATAPVHVDVSAPTPERLSEMNLFGWDAAEGFTYNDRVVPYTLATPLFTDYAVKFRAIYVPEGETIAFEETEVLDFPVGTVIVKTFAYPADLRAPEDDLDLIETRVLRLTDSGWETWPYIWNEDDTDAILSPAGETRRISFLDAQGVEQTANYLIPQRNQCRSCHERLPEGGGRAYMTPIGPAARHLDRDFDYPEGTVNQLDHLVDLGMLEGMPGTAAVAESYHFDAVLTDGLDAIAPDDLDHAARSYLEINCAHCHNPRGTQGVTSRLYLDVFNEDLFNLGVCKRPGSAGEGNGGLTYDIVPGNPDESILVFRTETTEVGAMMPLLGRSLRDDPGAAVVRAWVAAMEPQVCE